MSDKEKEIELLEQLCQMNGYFSEFFGKDLDQMKSNINNDYPIEFDTNFNAATANLESENKQIQKNHKAKIYSICETLLCVQQNGNEDNRLKERAVQEIGLHEVVKLKREIGLEWDSEDKDYLTKLLDLNN